VKWRREVDVLGAWIHVERRVPITPWIKSKATVLTGLGGDGLSFHLSRTIKTDTQNVAKLCYAMRKRDRQGRLGVRVASEEDGRKFALFC